MRWWAARFTRELPPLTVKARGVWHVCGTAANCFQGRFRLASYFAVSGLAGIWMYCEQP
jgi:hypothetical protein